MSHRGRDQFPAFQFAEGRPLPVIAAVLAALPSGMSNWQIAFWFVSSNPWLDGAVPSEHLDEPASLLDAARHEGEAAPG